MDIWTTGSFRYKEDEGDTFAKKIASEYLSNYCIEANGQKYILSEVEVRFANNKRPDIFNYKIDRDERSWTCYTDSENEYSQFIEANLQWQNDKKISLRINGIRNEDGKCFVGTKDVLFELSRKLPLNSINKLSFVNNEKIKLKKSSQPSSLTLLSTPRKASPMNDPDYNKNCWKNFRFYNMLCKDSLKSLRDSSHKQVVALSFYARSNEFSWDQIQKLMDIKSEKPVCKWINAFNDGIKVGDMSSATVKAMIRAGWLNQNTERKSFLYGAWCGDFGT